MIKRAGLVSGWLFVLGVTASTPVLAMGSAPSSRSVGDQGATLTQSIITVYDAPPNAGGHPVGTPTEVDPGTDPTVVLSAPNRPMAALAPGDVPLQDALAAPPFRLPTAAPSTNDFDVLESCYKSERAKQPNGWVLDHMRWCHVAYALLRVCVGPPGRCETVTGTAQWRQVTIGRGTNVDRDVTFSTGLDEWQITGNGGTGNFTISLQCVNRVGSACQNGGAPNSYTRSVAQWMGVSTAYFQLVSPQAGAYDPDPRHPGERVSSYDFHYSDSGVPGNTLVVTDNAFRCDSASYLPGLAGGCVFPHVDSLFTLHKGDAPEAAEHIYDAQYQPERTQPLKLNKMVPGIPGSGRPLTRNYDRNPQLRSQNTATAVQICKLYSPGYAALGKDCDEYAFATTFQGAASGDDYSARAISSTDNRAAGGKLSAFYSGQRILQEFDNFYTLVLQ